MPTNRKLVFANDEIYHVFNRGVEKRPTFTDRREQNRAILAMNFYRFVEPPVKLSRFLTIPKEDQMKLWEGLKKDNRILVEIICFCLMPNHFHIMLKQKVENGISSFISNFTNSYTKYFNKKHDRIGPLFEGIFKAVRIESEEQLIHTSRYIHLNPVSSFLIEPEGLESYEWSSYPEFLGITDKNLVVKNLILDIFPSVETYKKFVLDQVDYARQLELIKHLILE
ncbi:MAG: transposase [Candidatus Daviesbacteria bacterium]|nr:transposase [Candidatus Daviesbacteria bacterium]